MANRVTFRLHEVCEIVLWNWAHCCLLLFWWRRMFSIHYGPNCFNSSWAWSSSSTSFWFFFYAVNDEVPTQIFIWVYSQRLIEIMLINATWCTAENYDEEEEDDEFDPDVDWPKIKSCSENVNGYINARGWWACFVWSWTWQNSQHMIVNRLFEKFNPGHGGKRKRRDLLFRQKKNGWIIRIPGVITISVKSPEIKSLDRKTVNR